MPKEVFHSNMMVYFHFSHSLSYRVAPLDMRMDTSSKLTAREVVNTYSEKDLTSIFWQYGDDIFSARIGIL
jgi:16S rRNA (cytosine1402-N4)-methyltransferase